MNISLNKENYSIDNVYFYDPIKNSVIENSNFIRIIYSNSLFVLNGIYLSININYKSIDKYYNKFKCVFDVQQHKGLIDKLQNIEENLIKKYLITGKMPQYKLYDQFKQGYIKVFSNIGDKIDNTFLLKISGIWETDTEYGLTYKFISV